jgi:hypothetical protein
MSKQTPERISIDLVFEWEENDSPALVSAKSKNKLEHRIAAAITREREAQAELERKLAIAEKYLKMAVGYLREGKDRYAPNTTNSDVDVFLSEINAKEGEK